MVNTVPGQQLLARLERSLSALLPAGARLGVAVSGGPDSLALLCLAAAARPGEIAAATVDHGLRAESAGEAAMVADTCRSLGVPHSILPAVIGPGSSLQAKAREARYVALADWARKDALAAVLTAHHADDQAETLLMRLGRGAGVGGLAGVRPKFRHESGTLFIRPLLGWRKEELAAVVEDTGVVPVDDPTNRDERHDRTRARAFLANRTWPDAHKLAESAGHLADAEEALTFATQQLARERIAVEGPVLTLSAADLPLEFQRRLLLEAMRQLGAGPPRGPDLQRALWKLRGGGTCTLAGLRLHGGVAWRLELAPSRR